MFEFTETAHTNPCMVYLPTIWQMFMVNVDKYTIDGMCRYFMVFSYLHFIELMSDAHSVGYSILTGHYPAKSFEGSVCPAGAKC